MLHEMQEFVRESDVVEYEELVAWNLLLEEPVEYELYYAVADLEPYRAAMDAAESVRRYDLTRVDEDSFFVYVSRRTRPSDREFRAAFTDRQQEAVSVAVETG